MARNRIAMLRTLAPVIIPLVTRVALPAAMESLRRRRPLNGDGLEEAKDVLEKKVKKTRSEIEDLRDEAVTRGMKVYDEALTQGKQMLDLLADRGLEVAQDWLETVGRPKRRRFKFRHAVALIAVVGTGLYLFSRR